MCLAILHPKNDTRITFFKKLIGVTTCNIVGTLYWLYTIDLILDRRDQIINLCEMKYSLKAYDITPAYLQKLLERREIFRQASNTSKALHLTFVTASGIKKNAQEGMIQSEVGLDDLFGEKV